MPEIDGILIRRSTITFPINVRRFVDKAWTRNADCFTMDLEDSVPLGEKDNARQLVREYIPIVGKGGADIFVRINAGGKGRFHITAPFEMTRKDLEASVWPGLAGIAIPKISFAQEVREVDEIITALEKQRGMQPGSVEIRCGLETASSVLNAHEIATSSPRIKVFGGGASIDLLTDMGAEPGPGNPPDFGWSAQIPFLVDWLRLVAATAGKQSSGLGERVTVKFGDPGYADAVRTAAVKGRQFGSLGAQGIHPALIDPCNEGFTPSPSEVDYAKKILTVFEEEGTKKGIASINMDGRMIDIAVIIRAERLLARAEAIAKWDKMKAAIKENPGAREAQMRKAIRDAEVYEQNYGKVR
jgi:citrate lyase subunit beta / citryl-CoA lyase